MGTYSICGTTTAFFFFKMVIYKQKILIKFDIEKQMHNYISYAVTNIV